MYKKAITKDCPSCKIMIINDDNQFQCNWGKAKEKKILEQSKGRPKNCKLLKGK